MAFVWGPVGTEEKKVAGVGRWRWWGGFVG